jgi:hypothetical protein
LNFSLGLVIRNIVGKKSWELMEHITLLVCADDFNLLGININAVKKDEEALLNANNQFSLEVNTGLSVCSCLITTLAGQNCAKG